MPSAPKIRKQILSALEDSIIPALRRQEVAVARVASPFHFPAGIEARLISRSLPRAGADSSGYPVQRYWPKANLLSTFQPMIGFLYEGAADEHTFVNAAQASKDQISKGIYRIRWQSPSVLFFPPGVPHKAGRKGRYWDGPEPLSAGLKILWMDIAPTEIFVHTRIENQDQLSKASHSLQINDDTIVNLGQLFARELQGATPENQEIAQALLLPLMLCLQHHLQTEPAKLANTSFAPTPALNRTLTTEQPRQAWQEALIFIQLHLHEKLTLPLIARHVGFSPAHLSRLFHQFCGMPVMRYVQLQRISAAKEMLIKVPENVSEVAQMVGFSNASVFCSAFRRETGSTPNQFRRRARGNEGHL